jgi:hypothetical protein
MAITAGYAFNCTTGACASGIRAIYLANAQDLDRSVGYQNSGFTETAPGSGIFNAVTMDSGTDYFWKYEFQDFTGELRENAEPAEGNCTYQVSQEIELTIPCKSAALRNRLEELKSQSCCGIVAIVENMAGQMFAVGYLDKRHLKVLSTTATSGKALTDANNVVIILQALTTEYMHIFTGTIPVAP